MSEATKGNDVKVHYTGQLDDGTIFDSSEEREPLSFTLGEGQVIPGFEEAVEGMGEGEKKKTTIPAEQAYGPRRDELILSVPRERFPEDVDPEVGQRLQMQTQEGEVVPVVVADLEEDVVQLDANHPLAGKDLTFDIELIEVG